MPRRDGTGPNGSGPKKKNRGKPARDGRGGGRNGRNGGRRSSKASRFT